MNNGKFATAVKGGRTVTRLKEQAGRRSSLLGAALAFGLHLIVFVSYGLLTASCADRPENAVTADAQPDIWPDYAGVTIPEGIAPLNFGMADDGFDRIDVVVRGTKGGEVHANGADCAQFDEDDWHALVGQNLGADLTVTVSTKKDGRWTQWRDFPIHVSPHKLDAWGLTYRRIAPGYEVFSHMGLYQRCLANFEEEAIMENTHVPGMCVNCHTSHQTDPERFVFHVRGDHGATMVQTDGRREWLKASNEQLGGAMVYPYWHPSGSYCAFSTNQTRQGFHVVKDERIEVFDLKSDVLVYRPATHDILTDSLLSTPDWSENTPVFSPDGRTLYFITCRQQDYPIHFKDEQYNLCCIGFDPESGRFGDHVDTLFNAAAQGKSLTWPRPSYDGRFLLFTLMDYGYFSIWHEESDQWLMDLQTMEARPLDELNSPRADSFHNWSKDSRWVVFTSRRGDGLYSHLYLASIGPDGTATKPFLLPQRNPRRYYGESLYSFNTPDFTLRPVSFDDYAAAREIAAEQRTETTVAE